MIRTCLFPTRRMPYLCKGNPYGLPVWCQARIWMMLSIPFVREINISHLGKRIIFKSALVGDMLVLRRVSVYNSTSCINIWGTCGVHLHKAQKLSKVRELDWTRNPSTHRTSPKRKYKDNKKVTKMVMDKPRMYTSENLQLHPNFGVLC